MTDENEIYADSAQAREMDRRHTAKTGNHIASNWPLTPEQLAENERRYLARKEGDKERSRAVVAKAIAQMEAMCRTRNG